MQQNTNPVEQAPHGQPQQLDPMARLTEGRIVHYVMPNGKHRPAIVVQVWRVPDSPGPEPILKNPANGCCNLQVFSDGSNDLPFYAAEQEAFKNSGLNEADVRRGIFGASSRTYSEQHEPGTWHWIERA